MSSIKEFEHLRMRLQDIRSATGDFSSSNYIGKGGFGMVYKGQLSHPDGFLMVAVKRLDPAFGQGNPEFWKEVMMLSRYKHRNLISLLGFCDDNGEKILVYEYANRGSLDFYLSRPELTWSQRLKICIGAARGLEFLHNPQGSQQRVIHRDIKSANILLDENWNAKISDFGLSKLGPANQQFTFLVSNVAGTFGYCDPLYMETGLLTKESDVYSFGVVLFEVLCGRLYIGNHEDRRPLTGLVRESYQQNTLSGIIFDDLKNQINTNSLRAYTAIAYQCLNRERGERPTMKKILTQLDLALKSQEQIDDQVANMNLWPRTLEVPVLEANSAQKTPLGILHVKVLRAKLHDLLGESDPYVKIKLTESKLPSKKTTVKHKNLNPEWNEEFRVVVKDPETQAVELQVHDWELVGKHKKIGMNMVPLKDLPHDEPVVKTVDLLKTMDPNDAGNEKSRGQLVVELLYRPFEEEDMPNTEETDDVPMAPEGTPAGGGLLVVIVYEAQDVEGKHHTNPYVRILFRGEERKTKQVKKNRNPRWYEEFSFMLEAPPVNDRLHVEVASTSTWIGIVHPQESLGYIDISLADVVNNRRIKEMYHLIDSRNGRIQIELEWRTPS